MFICVLSVLLHFTFIILHFKKSVNYFCTKIKHAYFFEYFYIYFR